MSDSSVLGSHTQERVGRGFVALYAAAYMGAILLFWLPCWSPCR